MDESGEAHFVALARQLSNATMLQGPGFSIIEAIDPDAMVTLHVAGTQKVLEDLEDPSCVVAHVLVFYKGLANLLTTLTPKNAMRMYVACSPSHTTIHQRLAAAHIEPQAGTKDWDPFFSYEKRLLNLAAKDAELIQEAGRAMS